MNKLLLIFSLSFLSLPGFSSDLCVRSQQDLKNLLKTEESRMSFKNNGGLFNGGVCWWHSRLQRASSYLVRFKPYQNRPSAPELQMILHSLRAMNKVVVIPGYADFNSFTRDYHKEIQAMLNSWQRSDGFLNFEWLRGISGSSKLSPDKMRLRMEKIYAFTKKSPAPLWIMAQIRGIESHSLLVLNMIQTKTGYVLSVIDSNHPLDTVEIDYFYGDTFLHASGEKYNFVPYAGFQNDFQKISGALKKECSHLVDPLAIEGLPKGEVELSY